MYYNDEQGANNMLGCINLLTRDTEQSELDPSCTVFAFLEGLFMNESNEDCLLLAMSQ